MNTSQPTARAEADRKLFIGLARAFGGAIFFSLPLFMTMAMWHLGYYMDRGRLALFVVIMLPLLVVLDRYSGFLETSTVLEDVVDGVTAFGVGCVGRRRNTAALRHYRAGHAAA